MKASAISREIKYANGSWRDRLRRSVRREIRPAGSIRRIAVQKLKEHTAGEWMNPAGPGGGSRRKKRPWVGMATRLRQYGGEESSRVQYRGDIRRQLKYRVIDSASRVIYSTNKDYAINYFFLRVSNSAIEKAPKLLSPKKSPIQTSFPRKFSVDTFNFECINISPLYKRQRNFDNFYQSCDRLWIARAHTHHTHDTRCKIRFPPNAL